MAKATKTSRKGPGLDVVRRRGVLVGGGGGRDILYTTHSNDVST
jgi:hypothetical protein